MGFGYVSEATPALECCKLKLFNFHEGSPIEVAHPNLELLTLLRFSSAVNFLKDILEDFFKYSNDYLQSNCFRGKKTCP